MKPFDRDQYYKRIILKSIDPDYLEECGYNSVLDAMAKEYMPQRDEKTLTDRMQGYLMGLPSACTIPFYNYEIIEMAKETGLLKDGYTERQADKICEDYWHMMAAKVIQVSKGYRVPKGGN